MTDDPEEWPLDELAILELARCLNDQHWTGAVPPIVPPCLEALKERFEDAAERGSALSPIDAARLLSAFHTLWSVLGTLEDRGRTH